jgi:hypothetical protein
MGRCLAGLAIVALLQPLPAHATTANSLSARVVIDGALDDYTADEWVLDTGTTLREVPGDSHWGSDNDITRVALTWDREFLYIAVEARTFDSFLELFVSNRAGGLTTLEETGAFRRAIQLPFAVNLIALAEPGRIPDVARADDSHAFALVDRGAVPVAMAGTRTGPVGFEMRVPWSMLSLAQPVKLTTVITGEVGTGAGDAAPDASAALDTDRFARAVLDRMLIIDADTDDDNLADIGISPRTSAVVNGSAPAVARGEAKVTLSASPRTFAPERGETTNLRLDVEGVGNGQIYLTFTIYSMEGNRVRHVNDGSTFKFADGSLLLAWDGRDDENRVVRGGTYLVVADWGYNQGEHAGRAKTAVVVAR